jgi:hypothetical protein
MKILFDECVPWPLAKQLIGHECSQAQQCGWGGVKNGELLRVADPHFSLFITSDQGIEYQQNLKECRMAILLLTTNNLRRVMAAIGEIRLAIQTIQPGEFRRLDIP